MKATALTLMNALFLTTPIQEQVPKMITMDVNPVPHQEQEHLLLQQSKILNLKSTDTIVTNMMNYQNVRYSGQFYFGAQNVAAQLIFDTQSDWVFVMGSNCNTC